MAAGQALVMPERPRNDSLQIRQRAATNLVLGLCGLQGLAWMLSGRVLGLVAGILLGYVAYGFHRRWRPSWFIAAWTGGIMMTFHAMMLLFGLPAMFTGNAEPSQQMGLVSHAVHMLMNLGIVLLLILSWGEIPPPRRELP